MELYVIRHADALRVGEGGAAEDSERVLSDRGEKQAVAVGRMLQERGVRFDKLIASPYVRAQRTAELIIQQLKPAPELLTTETLVPEAKPCDSADYLKTVKGECIGVVGHLPHVAEFTGWLIGDRKIHLGFAKAGIAHLLCGGKAEKGLATLHWLVTPEWFLDGR